MLTTLLTVVCASLVSGEFDRYLYPSSTNLIAMVDMEAIKRSGLFEEELRQGFEQFATSNDQVATVARLIGFDPSKDISGFTVCGGGSGRRGASLVIVNGRFPLEKFNQELARLAEEGELTTMTVQDQPVYFNHRSRQAAYFSLLDATTIIMSTSKSLVEDSLKGLAELRQPSADLQTRMAWNPKETAGAAVNLAGLFPDEARRGMANIPPLAALAESFVGYNFTFHFGDPSRLVGRITLRDRNAADQAETIFRTMIGFGRQALANSERTDLREMLEKLSVSADGNDLSVKASISRELFEQMQANGRQQREEFRARRREAQKAEP